jgi:thiamine biosynthesis lipoprotein
VSSEASTRFDCFGGRCAVVISSSGQRAPAAALEARRRMLEWHEQFSRFAPGSELCALNRDPRAMVAVSGTMLRLVRDSIDAARLTGGLVDPTLLPELRAAGYRRSLHEIGGPGTVSLAEALAVAPPRWPATPRSDARWREVVIDPEAGTITRPPGLELDLGGVAKGAFGDILAATLGGHDSFAVDAAGDVRFGGSHTLPRAVRIAGPSGAGVLHTFQLQEGAAATSGIGRRAWSDPDGRPAHHLLDPATGRPAFTGLVQVTALAPTGSQAELRAKAALLSGPDRGSTWLPDGGALVAEDGAVTVLEPSPALAGVSAALAS